MHYTAAMKTATIPSIRVQPALRAEIEGLLAQGETLSQFVQSSVLESLERRRHQAEFVARGLASLEAARQSRHYVEADTALAALTEQLRQAKARAQSIAKPA